MAEPTDEFVVDEAQSEGGGGGKKKLLTIIMIGGIMLVEGVGIFFLARMFQPEPVAAEAGETEEEEAAAVLQREVEIVLPEVNAFNKREGRLYVYSMEISIRVNEEDAEHVNEVLQVRNATILDRINTVIRSAEVKYLNEPGLETLRRQLKHELEQIIGQEDIIIELLIPKFFQSPSSL